MGVDTTGRGLGGDVGDKDSNDSGASGAGNGAGNGGGEKDSIEGYGKSKLMVHTSSGTFAANSPEGKAAMAEQQGKWASQDAPYKSSWETSHPISSLQTFEQANPQQQNQFLNQASSSQIKASAYAADQAQMAAALGLGTTVVPPEVASTYAAGKEFREKRAAQVEKGAKGTAVSYREGVKSPVYSEQVSKVSATGGNVFIGGYGGYSYRPQNPMAITDQPQAQKEQLFSPMPQEQFNKIQMENEFKAANAPGVIGGMSLASGGWMTLNESKPAPVVRSTPTFDTRISENVMNVGATSETFFSPVRGAVEGFFAPSVKMFENTPILGDVAKFGYSLGTLPEAAIVKVPTAAIGVGSMIGYRLGTGTFGTPLPNQEKAMADVAKTATNPTFLISTVALAGLARGGMTGEIMPVEFAKLTVSETPKSGYVGIGVMGKPIIGAKIVGGEGSVQFGMPKFTSEPTAFKITGTAGEVNIADVMNPTEAAIHKTNIISYAERTAQPGIASRYTATESAAKFAYKTELPFEKGVGTIKEIPAIKGLPVQAQENLMGYVVSQKGNIQQIYGSFNAEVRGALARPMGDLDLQLKGATILKKAPSATEFGEGAIKAIERGGGQAKMVGTVLNVITKEGYVKAIDIHDVISSPQTAKPIGSGGGVGFGLRAKLPVVHEKLPYMTSGEQAARVGSSISVLRDVGGRKFLSPSMDNIKRTGDFIALVEKTAQVKGSSEYSKFGESFGKFLNPYEKEYFKANPEVASKVNIKLYESPSGKGSASLGISPASISGFSPSSSRSASVSPSFSISPSISPSRSASPSRSPSQSASISGISFSPSSSPSRSPSPSFSPSVSISPSISPSFSPSLSPSVSPSPSPYTSMKPPQTPPGAGMFDIGIRDMAGFGGKYKKPKGKYQPSFIAMQLGITTTKKEAARAELSGLGIRGIIGSVKKRRKLWE